MAIYVYTTITGNLFSCSPNDTDPVAPASTLTAAGLTAISGLPALSPTVAWDSVNKTTKTVAAPVAPNFIPTYEFILLFTPAEHSAIVASADAKVQQILMAISVAQQVDLNSATVQGAMAYLVSLNLVTQANATLILSGSPSQ